ncbi:inner nuclear membrane protein enriched at telomere/subtelomere region [Mortierella sp. AM989]|nr:inner nuclear membrane protein enriched at telomere/subtelomere region [Mortierella sp. AM989]
MPKEPLPRYLHPDYDPMKEKMDRLREILIHNKVKTPSGNVRKQDFVDLFEKHIRPQVPTLRHYYENIVASEKGIIKVPASAMTSLLNTNSKPKMSISSKSTAAEPSGVETPKSLALSTSSATSSSSVPSPSETAPKTDIPGSEREHASKIEKAKIRRRITSEKGESEISMDSIRGRKSRSSSSIKEDIDTDGATGRRKRRSEKKEKKKTRSENFSDENPFQSGGESERRRRSKSREDSSISRSPSRSRSSRSRRKPYDEFNGRAMDHNDTYNSRSQLPFSGYMHTPKYTVPPFGKADVDAGPFHSSPLLAKSRRISAATTLHPKSLPFGQSAQFQGATGDFRRYNENRNTGPLRLIIFFAVFIFGMWYRQARFRIGFCTATNNPTNHSNSWNQQTWDWIYPTCIPCPTHATCPSPYEKPICPPEYILRPHPLNLGNFLPLTPECVLNRAKEYQSLQVADVAEQILHQRAGIEECKMFSQPPKTAELLSRQQMSINELKREIEDMKDPSVSQHDFEQYWDLALKELHRRSDTIAIFQRGSIGGFLIRRHILKRREEERVIQGLVDNVLSKLADQSHYHYIDPVLCLDPYLPQIHLRDALLTNELAPVKRQELWDKVSAIVDRNANVRVSAQEVRGEIHRVWEWIGATGVLGRSAMGNRSSFFSGSNFHTTTALSGENPTMVSPQTGSNDSLFGATGDSDLEFVNPARSLYPSLLKELEDQ